MDRNNVKDSPCQCFWSAVGRTQNFGHNDDGLTKVLYCDCDCDCDVLLVLLRGSMIDTTTRKCGRDWWTTKLIATTWKSRCRENDYNDRIGRSSINSWKGLVFFGWVLYPLIVLFRLLYSIFGPLSLLFLESIAVTSSVHSLIDCVSRTAYCVWKK